MNTYTFTAINPITNAPISFTSASPWVPLFNNRHLLSLDIEITQFAPALFNIVTFALTHGLPVRYFTDYTLNVPASCSTGTLSPVAAQPTQLRSKHDRIFAYDAQISLALDEMRPLYQAKAASTRSYLRTYTPAVDNQREFFTHLQEYSELINSIDRVQFLLSQARIVAYLQEQLRNTLPEAVMQQLLSRLDAISIVTFDDMERDFQLAAQTLVDSFDSFYETDPDQPLMQRACVLAYYLSNNIEPDYSRLHTPEAEEYVLSTLAS